MESLTYKNKDIAIPNSNRLPIKDQRNKFSERSNKITDSTDHTSLRTSAQLKNYKRSYLNKKGKISDF